MGFRGDWKALVQIFNLSRTYNHDEARIWETEKIHKFSKFFSVVCCLNNLFQLFGKLCIPQICWLCQATKGLHSLDLAFTDISDNAGWLSTLLVGTPWAVEPPYARLPGFSVEMIIPDLLHIWNLGMAQSVGGSILKQILQEQVIFNGPNLDSRFSEATESLRAFARHEKLPLRLKKLTKTRLRWKTRGYPELACSGYDTFVICKWLQCILTPFSDVYTDFCTLLWSGNHAVSVCYSAGWWLSPAEKATLHTVGNIFMCTYIRLASESVAGGRFLFRARPKLHMLHHVFKWRRGVNPAKYATWNDEDFLKRIGRVLKLVSALSAQKRILERWLMNIPETIRKHMR